MALIAHYKGESGALTTDSSNGYTLTNNNSVGEGTGVIDEGCFDFGATNTNKFMHIANDLGIGASTSSFAAWIKVYQNPPTNENYFITHQSDSTTHVGFYLYYANSADTLQLTANYFKGGVSDNYRTYDVDLDDDGWHHVALTFSGTTLKIYLDGSQVGADLTVSGNGTSGGSDVFAIGNPGAAASSSNIMEGLIDDVRVYDSELTSGDISSLWTAGQTTTSTSSSTTTTSISTTTTSTSTTTTSTSTTTTSTSSSTTVSTSTSSSTTTTSTSTSTTTSTSTSTTVTLPFTFVVEKIK